MEEFKQGDFFKVPFSFSDQSGEKSRLVVVVSKSRSSKGDYIVCKCTATLENDTYSYPLLDSKLTLALPKKCEVRMNVIATIHESTIIKLKQPCSIKEEYLGEFISKVVSFIK